MTENNQAVQMPAGQSPDNDLPPGDFPKPPAWRLPLAVAAWVFWFIFLCSMAWFRSKQGF